MTFFNTGSPATVLMDNRAKEQACWTAGSRASCSLTVGQSI